MPCRSSCENGGRGCDRERTEIVVVDQGMAARYWIGANAAAAIEMASARQFYHPLPSRCSPWIHSTRCCYGAAYVLDKAPGSLWLPFDEARLRRLCHHPLPLPAPRRLRVQISPCWDGHIGSSECLPLHRHACPLEGKETEKYAMSEIEIAKHLLAYVCPTYSFDPVQRRPTHLSRTSCGRGICIQVNTM